MEPQARERRFAAAGERQPHLLLAEDDVEMRRLLTWTLEKAGYHVTACRDGKELLRKLGVLDPYAETANIDLVISDIRMPGYSGLEVLEGARELEDCPPVLLISAFADDEARRRAGALGALDVLAKPFDLDVFVERVQGILPADYWRTVGEPPARADTETAGEAASIPLDVTFRHGEVQEPIRDFVGRLATRLQRFGSAIQHVHVVIDHPDTGNGKIAVSLVVTTAHRTIVANHDSRRDAGDESVYAALRVTFGVAARQLKQLREKQRRSRSRRRGRDSSADPRRSSGDH
jgi:two-component system response regulator AtoC